MLLHVIRIQLHFHCPTRLLSHNPWGFLSNQQICSSFSRSTLPKLIQNIKSVTDTQPWTHMVKVWTSPSPKLIWCGGNHLRRSFVQDVGNNLQSVSRKGDRQLSLRYHRLNHLNKRSITRLYNNNFLRGTENRQLMNEIFSLHKSLNSSER